MTSRSRKSKPRTAQQQPLCGAHRPNSDLCCTRPAGWGTSHPGTGRCKRHGGSTPSHVVAAQREQAREAAHTYGLRVDVDPRDALLQEVHRTAGAVAWIGEQVQALDTEAVVWGTAQVKERQVPVPYDEDNGEGGGVITISETTMKAVLNVWVQLYQSERRHLREVCRDAIAAGIAERQVRLAEEQGALLVGVIRAILVDLNLTAEQSAAVTEVVPRHLRAVSTGPAA